MGNLNGSDDARLTGHTRLADDARLAAELVTAAGTLAREMREQGVESTRKTSVSDVVTDADHAAEALVVQRLADERPEDGIVGEEGAARASSSGRTWVIDPVDGTYNFVHGLPWWCSALALRDESDVLLGAVCHPFAPSGTSRATRTNTSADHNPHLGVWVGGPGLPTTSNGQQVAPIEDRSLAAISAATYLHPTWLSRPEVAAAWQRAARLPATIRMLGSGSMDLSAVADGRIGIWFQHSVPAWDWLPGSALVRGAGGEARQVEAGGVTWSIAGPRTAVAEVAAALTGR